MNWLPSFSHPSSGIRKAIPIHVSCIPNIFVNLTPVSVLVEFINYLDDQRGLNFICVFSLM